MGDMTTWDVLTAARRLVVKGWTQGAHLRDSEGEEMDFVGDGIFDVPDCTASFCPDGAVIAVCGESYSVVYQDAIDALEFELPDGCTPVGPPDDPFNGNLSSWNDEPSRVKGDVVSLFDRAILSTGGRDPELRH